MLKHFTKIVITKVYIEILIIIKIHILGSTLVLMHSNEEPNSFFGGMAAPSWNSKEENICDPAGECSWLFKIEAGKNM